MTDQETLRASFDGAAREYDAIRPGYPEALIEDVITLSRIPPGGRILEIGCGTGQATLPFTRRGYRLLCLDIGEALLAVAAENLRDYPNVRFIHSAFERWPTRVGKFDLVISATAFHWVPPDIGYPKSALALRPGGALAIFSNWHPKPYDGFFVDVQPIYRRHVPEWGDPPAGPPCEVEIQNGVEKIRATGLFEWVEARSYPWSVTYTSAEYTRLLNTYSNHLMLEPQRREALYRDIAALIDQRYGGHIERPYLSVLYLARKAGITS